MGWYEGECILCPHSVFDEEDYKDLCFECLGKVISTYNRDQSFGFFEPDLDDTDGSYSVIVGRGRFNSENNSDVLVCNVCGGKEFVFECVSIHSTCFDLDDIRY